MAPSAFQWPSGKRAAVSLTFDDARESQVSTGIPTLDRHGVRGTFYVVPGNVEPRREAWRRAAAAGHEIGNHTVTHPCSANFPFARGNALEDYTLERIEGEIAEANRRLRELVGVTPRTFAYPCGQTFVGRGAGCASYVPVVARHFLAGRGFRDDAVNDPLRCDLAQLCGTDGDGLGFEELRRETERAAAEGGWIIFCGHEIGSEEARGQTITAAALDRFCACLQDPASGLWVDTVAAVAEHVQRARKA